MSRSGVDSAITADRTGNGDDVRSVRLRGVVVALNTDVGRAFVTDCARHIEGSLSDSDIKGKWGLRRKEWEGLAANLPLLRAVQGERDRRMASGEAAREAAQRHYAKAPDVLGGILTDKQVSPRHRIEAAKELRQVVDNELETASGPTEKFVININLGGDEKLVYEKRIAARNPSPPDDGGQS